MTRAKVDDGGCGWMLFAFLALCASVAYTWDFWVFVAAAVVQLFVGGGVEGFPSPSVFP